MRYPIYRQALLRMCLGVLSFPAAIGTAWVCVAPYWATCRRCGAQMITDTGVNTSKLPVHLRPGEGE